MQNGEYPGELLSRNCELRAKLNSALSTAPQGKSSGFFEKAQSGSVLLDADVVVTPNEVNGKHGTGTLVSRIFPDSSNIISIRSQDHYGGEHQFGTISYCLTHQNISRPQAFANVLESLGSSTVRRVFCVPYYPDDLLTAIAIKKIFDVPLAAYIMDDQNIYAGGIPDNLMDEFLQECTLRFAIHSELRDAYESKYGLKFWILPAIVPGDLISTAAPALNIRQEGVLVGSIWSEKWFALLRKTVRTAGATLDWYGNDKSSLFTFTDAELQADGIRACGLIPQQQLAQELKTFAYAVATIGSLDAEDDRQEVSHLSLPSRIPFILATSNTPIIVLGSAKTAAARFVERFKIGVVCDYDGASFQQAVEKVTAPEMQNTMRANAAAIAERFSSNGVAEWIWGSLERGEPADLRFEDLLPRLPGDIVAYIDPPVPKEIYKSFVPVYEVMRRLKNQGLKPDFVIDVGASTGIWSHTVSHLFASAQFFLIDPLISRYDQKAKDYFLAGVPNRQLFEVAVSNYTGRVSFQVSPDLYGSSLLQPADFRCYDTVEVNVDTLDSLAKKQAITGRGILKIDVQCAEHLVLEGAKEFLNQVDVVVLELSLVRYDTQAKVLSEMLELMQGLGYRYYDDIGCGRSPVDGTLLQKDILFVQELLFPPQVSR